MTTSLIIYVWSLKPTFNNDYLSYHICVISETNLQQWLSLLSYLCDLWNQPSTMTTSLIIYVWSLKPTFNDDYLSYHICVISETNLQQWLPLLSYLCDLWNQPSTMTTSLTISMWSLKPTFSNDYLSYHICVISKPTINNDYLSYHICVISETNPQLTNQHWRLLLFYLCNINLSNLPMNWLQSFV